MIREYRMWIDGRWCGSEDHEILAVEDPSTQQTIAYVQAATEAQVGQAVRSAISVREMFRRTPVGVRYRLLLRIAGEIEKDAEKIARMLSLEQGKPLFREAIPEVEGVIADFRQAAEDLLRMNGEVISSTADGTKAVVVREADGVYGVITPWNYPLDMAVQYIAPCLAVGNPVVYKPASSTPICSILMAEAMERAFLQENISPKVFQLVTGTGAKVGSVLAAHPLLDGIAFTGETSTGIEILRRAGLKKVVLELGGNGPTIVLDDCDVRAAAEGAAAGLLDNAGQICSGTERILVQRGVKDAFLRELLQCMRTAKLGSPLSPDTTLGPLNNEAGVRKLELQVQDAVAKGAKLLCGGHRAPQYGSRLFFEPTVLDGVTDQMLIYQEETFGPVAPVTVFDADEDALRMSGDSGYGLQMAVFTRSMRRARRFAAELRTGCVSVNLSSEYYERQFPFGGAVGTRSGWGRVGGKFGLEQVSHVKSILVNTEVQDDAF